MQISLDWIYELVDLKTVNLDDLVNKLTLGGFEVEEVLKVELGNKKISALDISATANRSDSLSIQGLSIEMAALFDQQLKRSTYVTQTYSWLDSLDRLSPTDKIKKNGLSFVSVTVENLSNFNSPDWLKQKLISSGIIPQNNLEDFKNYIILETGYPLEFYDLRKIYSKLKIEEFQLHLTKLKNPNYFVANNNEQYELYDPTLMLLANDLPISLAGIIPSKFTDYSEATHSLLIEGSLFQAAKIRQRSRELGLRTERSSRYEKSLKSTNLLESVYRLVSLLRITNPKLVCKLHTIEESSLESTQVIKLSHNKVKQILGPIGRTVDNKYRHISSKVVTDLLKRLQFNVEYNGYSKNDYNWQVKVPTLRSNDITQEIDLIEEIGRIYGFNNFITRLPRINTIGIEDSDYQNRKKLTACLLNLGLTELIQYSLVQKKTYLKNNIELVNPLIKDYSSLRSSLLPNLLKATEDNLKKGNLTLEGFEYGHIFLRDSNSVTEETENVAGVFGGIKMKSRWSEKLRTLSWFEAKGKIEQLFKKLNISIYWKIYQLTEEKNILHPYRTAQIFSKNNTIIGIFGQISPLIAKKLNISPATYLFEFNFETIKNQMEQNKVCAYQEYSLYPKIIKDLSFIIKDDVTFDKIEELLHLNGSKFLTEINLLDEYRGNNIPQNHISLCLQLVFHSNYETLENKKIETIITSLINLLTEKFNAIFRD